MTKTATVNYHIHKPERQAFELDADGIVGKLISPELVATEISVLDERAAAINMAFERTSVEFAAFETDANVLDDDRAWQPSYEADIQHFLKSKLDIDEIVIFDHTVRIDDDASDRKPARNVHSDFCLAV